MENKALHLLQELVGKKFKGSPSALTHWLEPTVISAERGMLSCEYEVRPDMGNAAGILHGGVMAAIMDDIIGAAVFTLGEEFFYTSINLNVDFLLAGKIGEKIIAKAKVVREGKTIVHASCKLFNQEGKLMAKSSSNLIRTAFQVKL
jgi:acyl-coenzyme A thioesterase 13